MDRNRAAIGEARAMLVRIVALLLALAGLAEIARRRDVGVACLVLSILRPAEAATGDFLGAAAMPAATTDWYPEADEELACLAVRFRVFAALIAGWARLAGPFVDGHGPTSACDIARFLWLQRLDGACGSLPVQLIDTS